MIIAKFYLNFFWDIKQDFIQNIWAHSFKWKRSAKKKFKDPQLATQSVWNSQDHQGRYPFSFGWGREQYSTGVYSDMSFHYKIQGMMAQILLLAIRNFWRKIVPSQNTIIDIISCTLLFVCLRRNPVFSPLLAYCLIHFPLVLSFCFWNEKNLRCSFSCVPGDMDGVGTVTFHYFKGLVRMAQNWENSCQRGSKLFLQK